MLPNTTSITQGKGKKKQKKKTPPLPPTQTWQVKELPENNALNKSQGLVSLQDFRKENTVKLKTVNWCSKKKKTKTRTTDRQEVFFWPVHFGWPYMAWFIVSLSQTRLWSMWSVWLVFYDCSFHSVFPLKADKRLVEAFWWERLAVGKT